MVKRAKDIKGLYEDNTERVIDIGLLLKTARTEKGITLEYVTQYTRIRLHFLEALENNDFKSLPERTYALGYLRTYAKFLELKNIDELVEVLDKSYQFSNPMYSNRSMRTLEDEYSLVNNLKRKFSNKAREDSSFSGNRVEGNQSQSGIIIFVLIISIVIGIIFYFLKGDSEQTTQDIRHILDQNEFIITDNNINNQTTNRLQNKDLNVVDNSQSIDQKSKSLKNNTLVYKMWPRETKPRDIKINFKERVWVLIYNGSNKNEIYLDKIFNQNDTFLVPGVDNIVMKVGNYKGVEFVIGSNKLQLTSSRVGNVLDGILLDSQYLLDNYSN